MKEEEKLRAFVNTVETEVGLQRKKTRIGNYSEVDDCLYKWFVQKRSESVPINGIILKAKAIQFNKLLGGDDTFIPSNGWLGRWKIRHGIRQINLEGEAASNDVEAAGEFPKHLKKCIEDGGYNDEQIYNCDETALYYRLLPNKTLDIKKQGNKSGLKTNKDRITLLLCTNKTGNHKLKPLCIGKSRSPRCFKHVNMMSLPVVYESSSNAWMTCDIFTKWFEKEFVPSVRRYLRHKKLEEKALLLLDNCPAHPSVDVLQSRDGKITAKFLPKNTTALIQPLDQGIIRTFKAHYRGSLLSEIVNSDMQVNEFLKSQTLKHASYNVGVAWGKVGATSIANCWKKCLGAEESANVSDPVEIPDGELKSVAKLLQMDLQKQDISEWIDADFDSPIALQQSEEEIAASVRAFGEDKCEIPEDESDEDEVEASADETVPKVNKVIENINEIITWMERQTDSEHLHMLNLVTIKQYALKKRSQQLQQTKVSDFFFKTTA
jgi:hypothetical protein